MRLRTARGKAAVGKARARRSGRYTPQDLETYGSILTCERTTLNSAHLLCDRTDMTTNNLGSDFTRLHTFAKPGRLGHLVVELCTRHGRSIRRSRQGVPREGSRPTNSIPSPSTRTALSAVWATRTLAQTCWLFAARTRLLRREFPRAKSQVRI